MISTVENEGQPMELHTDESLGEVQEAIQQPRAATSMQTRRKKIANERDRDELSAAVAEHEYSANAIRRALERVKGTEFKKDSADAAEIRPNHVKEHYKKFMQVHATVVNAADSKRKTQLNNIRYEIEEAYLFTMGEFATKMRKGKTDDNTSQPLIQIPFRESEVRNTWGEFDGAIKKWPGFRDRFVAAVHNNVNISPAYKFQHLSQSLTGKAARTLGEWQLTADNYQLAWERLLQLYDDKNAICRELLRAFFKLPVLSGPPRANDLQRMSNVTHETMRQLKAQGVPVEHWNVIIVHVLQERLDAETGRQWELQRNKEFATVAEMLRFLYHQAAALATAAGNGRERERPRNVSSVVMRPALRENRRRTEGERHVKRLPCTYCGSMHHPIWECNEFQAVSVLARKEFVEKAKLCTNCLKTGHCVRNCFQGPCQLCKPICHNSLLCTARWTQKKRQAKDSESD